MDTVFWRDEPEGVVDDARVRLIRSFISQYNNATHQGERDEVVEKTRAFVESLGDDGKDLREKMTYPDAKGVWNLKI